MAAQRDPLLHFSAEEQSRGQRRRGAAVNRLLLRTGQGYLKIARKGERETDRQAVRRNHSSHETDRHRSGTQFVGTGQDSVLLGKSICGVCHVHGSILPSFVRIASGL